MAGCASLSAAAASSVEKIIAAVTIATSMQRHLRTAIRLPGNFPVMCLPNTYLRPLFGRKVGLDKLVSRQWHVNTQVKLKRPAEGPGVLLCALSAGYSISRRHQPRLRG